jgi:hypothetical protein
MDQVSLSEDVKRQIAELEAGAAETRKTSYGTDDQKIRIAADAYIRERIKEEENLPDA